MFYLKTLIVKININKVNDLSKVCFIHCDRSHYHKSVLPFVMLENYEEKKFYKIKVINGTTTSI